MKSWSAAWPSIDKNCSSLSFSFWCCSISLASSSLYNKQWKELIKTFLRKKHKIAPSLQICVIKARDKRIGIKPDPKTLQMSLIIWWIHISPILYRALIWAFQYSVECELGYMETFVGNGFENKKLSKFLNLLKLPKLSQKIIVANQFKEFPHIYM